MSPKKEEKLIKKTKKKIRKAIKKTAKKSDLMACYALLEVAIDTVTADEAGFCFINEALQEVMYAKRY